VNFAPVKRIIDGVSYNTETSTLLGSRSTKGDPVQYTPHGTLPSPAVEQLFRNRSGKLFFVLREIPIWISSAEGFSLRDEVLPTTREVAGTWLQAHFPDSQEAFVMNLKFAPQRGEPEAEAALSLRVDQFLKSLLKSEAESRGLSINALCVLYLRYGLNQSVGRPYLPPGAFTIENDVRVLTDDGKPGLHGIADNGDHQELNRAQVANAFWSEGKMIPQEIRNALKYSLMAPEPERTQLLGDIQRWLELYERKVFSLADSALVNLTSSVFTTPA
jgi:hypothetical protein